MKVLVTGGCSFSECISTHIDTWPRHLARVLPEYQHISTALGSQGNGLISRRIIYQVNELLKTHQPDDLLVGVMWSGNNRQDFYTQNHCDVYTSYIMENPTRFIKHARDNWVLMSHNWNDPLSEIYYKTFFDFIGNAIISYEHILRTQWFLKLHGIKYFMTTYTGEVFSNDLIDHIDVEHLYEQIDFSNFLPVVGEYEWCRDYSNLEFPTPGDNHPSSDQHKAFTTEVILPFLKL